MNKNEKQAGDFISTLQILPNDWNDRVNHTFFIRYKGDGTFGNKVNGDCVIIVETDLIKTWVLLKKQYSVNQLKNYMKETISYHYKKNNCKFKYNVLFINNLENHEKI
ncbi:hypothetical protein COB55_05145 [Candidatus Wolfebacteria bacterium]|nr:MAG: hypothetical protein COB55_05145 [Candidatus Wolfebacteria bacterium]